MPEGDRFREDVRPPPPTLPRDRDGVLYATGVILLPLGLIPLGFGLLVLVGYGLAESEDLGLLIPILVTCVLLSAGALAGGVRLIRKSYLSPSS